MRTTAPPLEPRIVELLEQELFHGMDKDQVFMHVRVHPEESVEMYLPRMKNLLRSCFGLTQGKFNFSPDDKGAQIAYLRGVFAYKAELLNSPVVIAL